MQRSILKYMLLIWLWISLGFVCLAQESVFTGLKSNLKKADRHYVNQEYLAAAILYDQMIVKNANNNQIILKLANSYFLSNQMKNAAHWYGEFEKNNGQLSLDEELRFASALHASGLYGEAIAMLQDYQNKNSNDPLIQKKIWQLQNVHFLKEDSAFYEIEGLSINSTYDESGPMINGNTLVFMSNREIVSIIKRVDANSGKPFFNWFKSEISNPNTENSLILGKPVQFGDEIKSKFHKGAICFDKGGSIMIYSKVVGTNIEGKLTPKLFFAEKINGKWQEMTSFTFNSEEYSVTNPFLAFDGKRLYFSSDMPGGYGAMDLYYSDFVNNSWTRPINLGQEINTSQNESHPFIFGTTLYFSSDGQAGLGGLDIFHVDLEKKPLEVLNHGYPVNTYHDDFGLVLDKSGSAGYFCSNRDHKGDDIYSIKYKKLSFPLQVSGQISFKKSDFSDDAQLLVKLANADIELIEKESQKVVYTSKTNRSGIFEIEIPYESKFLLRVKQENLGIAIVSMEIPKNHRDYLNHDIVIVQDLFNVLPDEEF